MPRTHYTTTKTFQTSFFWHFHIVFDAVCAVPLLLWYHKHMHHHPPPLCSTSIQFSYYSITYWQSNGPFNILSDMDLPPTSWASMWVKFGWKKGHKKSISACLYVLFLNLKCPPAVQYQHPAWLMATSWSNFIYFASYMCQTWFSAPLLADSMCLTVCFFVLGRFGILEGYLLGRWMNDSYWPHLITGPSLNISTLQHHHHHAFTISFCFRTGFCSYHQSFALHMLCCRFLVGFDKGDSMF